MPYMVWVYLGYHRSDHVTVGFARNLYSYYHYQLAFCANPTQMHIYASIIYS